MKYSFWICIWRWERQLDLVLGSEWRRKWKDTFIAQMFQLCPLGAHLDWLLCPFDMRWSFLGMLASDTTRCSRVILRFPLPQLWNQSLQGAPVPFIGIMVFRNWVLDARCAGCYCSSAIAADRARKHVCVYRPAHAHASVLTHCAGGAPASVFKEGEWRRGKRCRI